MHSTAVFQPNWVSLPGNTIGDILTERNFPLSEFAQKMGFTRDEVKGLLNGVISINQDIANKLADTIGPSANFWLSREKNYQASVTNLKEEEGKKWFKELPIKDMIEFGWLNYTHNMVETCLNYFDVPNVWVWKKKYGEQISTTAFKKSDKLKSSTISISTWIRQGEIQAESVVCKKWDQQLLKASLPNIRRLTKRRNAYSFLPMLKKVLAQCGIALVIVPTPTQCPVSGAVKFIKQDKAMILLSFRYRSEDRFWFTLFHEIGHLLLHGDTHLFIDSEDISSVGYKEEEEANTFAFNELIPKEFQQLLCEIPLTDKAFKEFAKMADLPVGIVIGQLQNMGRIQYNHFNKYIRRYTKEEVFKKY